MKALGEKKKIFKGLSALFARRKLYRNSRPFSPETERDGSAWLPKNRSLFSNGTTEITKSEGEEKKKKKKKRERERGRKGKAYP